MKSKFKYFLLLFLFLLFSYDIDKNKNLDAQNQPYSFTNNEYTIFTLKQNIESELINEVNNYINTYCPGSKITASYFVKLCLEYDISIVFALAQGVLESHMGTRGLSLKTNSVWNVGTYDDGKIFHKYNNPDESIEPYLKLLRKKYLISISEKGDTIQKELHLLIKDNNYININGKRFASNKNYEKSLRNIMLDIYMKTKISTYESLLKSEDTQLLYLTIK